MMMYITGFNSPLLTQKNNEQPMKLNIQTTDYLSCSLASGSYKHEYCRSSPVCPVSRIILFIEVSQVSRLPQLLLTI